MNTFSASFKANAGIKDIVGQGLIYDDSIAIIELVKNAKDAGSTQVKIEFKNLKDDPKLTQLVISDSGSGMSLADIKNKWLNIAYSEKKKAIHTGTYAGNKGVGRFSCDRLGKSLDLYTKSRDGDFIKLPILWSKFEGKEIEDEVSTISLIGELLEKNQFLKEIEKDTFESGTVLNIKGLRSTWNASKLKKLIGELEKFSPSLDSTFEVYLYTDTDYGDKSLKNKTNRKIDNGILDKLAFKTTHIKSSIDSRGEFIETALFYHDQEIYRYKAVNPYLTLKNIKAEIHYLDTISKTYFTKNVGVNPNSYGSVFLFYNGFRISPYGNEKNDWLSLDQRKSQGTSRNLGTREVFGRIDIKDVDNTFSVITSREGLAHNNAYFDLVSHEVEEKTLLKNGKDAYGFIPVVIRQLESFVVSGIQWNRVIDKHGDLSVVSADDAKKDPKRFKMKALSPESVDKVCQRILKSNLDIIDFNINNELVSDIQKVNEEKYKHFLNDFVTKTKDKSLSELSAHEKGVVKRIIEREVGKTEKAIEERDIAEEKANNASKELEIEKQQRLYLLTTRKTLSPDADGLIHTVKINNINVRNITNNLLDDVTDNLISPSELIDKLTSIKLAAEKSIKMAELVTYAKLDRDIDAKNIDIVTYIKEYLASQEDMKYGYISVQFNDYVTKQVRKLNLLSLSIVLDNLISNSKKWGASRISVDFSDHKQGCKVIFSDDGHGLSSKYLSNPAVIFELGVRDSLHGEIPGSGIGLFHVRKLLEEMNANICFKGNGSTLKGASFEMEFK